MQSIFVSLHITKVADFQGKNADVSRTLRGVSLDLPLPISEQPQNSST